jgi:hypothetical protein
MKTPKLFVFSLLMVIVLAMTACQAAGPKKVKVVMDATWHHLRC